MQLSVVVPLFREEKTIKQSLRLIASVLRRANLDFEIILVVDGPAIMPPAAAPAGHAPSVMPRLRFGTSGVKIYDLKKNHGKGYAVCFGMRRAKGEAVAFIDGGGEYEADLLLFFWHFLKATKADIIVGSKLHPASKVSYPLGRKILSKGYQILTRILFGLWVRDTQAGIKMFKKEVVKNVVPKLLVKSYAFDVEFLAVAAHLGFNKIYEAPINLKWKGGWGLSSKKIWKVIFRMLWDTLAVFYRLNILKYYDKERKTRF